MSLRTIIQHRTEEKEIRLSGSLVMTRDEWLSRGGVYHGGLKQAAQQGYYTVRGCEKIGKPVSEEEFERCKDFAMFKSCYMDYCIGEHGRHRPCLPVFYREREKA